MSHYSIVIVFLFITIGLFIGTVFMAKSDIYKGQKNEDECNKVSSGGKCGVWDASANICFKGVTDPKKLGGCFKKPDYGPLVLLILSVMSLILFFVFLVMGLTQGSGAKSQFSYGNNSSVSY